MRYYDAHLHNTNNEIGGFLIGLEGEPKYTGVLTNAEVIGFHKEGYIPFYYVSRAEIHRVIEHRYLKYHPRREEYTPNEVIESIKINNPNAVMIDTLNEPYWNAYDYWMIAREFNDIVFVFAHAGGYLINEFIKICNFQKNVYIDFSLTHCVLAKYGNEKGLRYVNEAIEFALNSGFSNRILLGTDYPFYSQDEVIEYYNEYLTLLNNNFEELFEKIKERIE